MCVNHKKLRKNTKCTSSVTCIVTHFCKTDSVNMVTTAIQRSVPSHISTSVYNKQYVFFFFSTIPHYFLSSLTNCKQRALYIRRFILSLLHKFWIYKRRNYFEFGQHIGLRITVLHCTDSR